MRVKPWSLEYKGHLPNLVVPLEDIDSLSFNEVHGLAGLGDEGSQGIEHITLLDGAQGQSNLWKREEEIF